MKKVYSMFLLVSFLSFGCGTNELPVEESVSDPEFVVPSTDQQAREIAERVAKDRNIDIEDYQDPQIQFHEGRGEWWISYTLKPPGMPGGHFTVIIDDTGRTRFMGGR